MYQNNNKAVINKISMRSIKVNKMRNSFAVTAIILTTVMFTSLFCICLNVIKSFEYSSMRQVGSSAHGGFKTLTKKQFEILHKHKSIKGYGSSVFLGLAQNPRLAKRQVEIRYCDKNFTQYAFIAPLVKGRMPQAENEIVLDTFELKMLGIKYASGKKVTIDYDINGKKHSKQFVLSGYYKGDKLNSASFACVSKKFADEMVKKIDLKLSKESGYNAGFIDMEIMFDSKFNIAKKLRKIISDSGFSISDINYGANWAYIGGGDDTSEDFKSIIGMIILIMLSGYLIIYNIFYISIVKDIHFYGLLKTVGTTSKQLKKLILKQAVFLCCIAIPIGLIIGYFVGASLTPSVMASYTATNTVIALSPIPFIIAAVFSFVTVMISCIKPAKIASKISPIDAVRYTGVSEKSNKIIKKTTRGGKLYRMALSNFVRNKRKMIISVTSLALSIILLDCTYTIIKGFDINTYLEPFLCTDFNLGDTSFYRWRFDAVRPNSLTQNVSDEISQIAGVKKISKIYASRLIRLPLNNQMETLLKKQLPNVDKRIISDFKYALKSKEMFTTIYGADHDIYNMLNHYVVSGKINAHLLDTGKYAIIRRDGNITANVYKVGDKISLPNDYGKTREFTVSAIVDDVPLYLFRGSTCSGGVEVYIPSNKFIEITRKPSIMTAMFNVNHRYISYVEKQIKGMVKQNPTLDYRSKATYLKEYKGMLSSYSYMGYTLSFILALIGLLNFINVVITNIMSRKHEFATMQSVGMTSKMLRKMLIYEGLYYAIATTVSALILNVPINLYAVKALVKNCFFEYKFTTLPILLCAPALILLTIIVPVISFKSINKSSIVERLRETE